MRWNGKESVGVAHDPATILFMCLHKATVFFGTLLCWCCEVRTIFLFLFIISFWIGHSMTKYTMKLLIKEIRISVDVVGRCKQLSLI